MIKHNVRTPADALAYLTDENLSTVYRMAMKSKRPKFEFDRQISIAQTAVTWMQQMGVDASSIIIKEVIDAGSVKAWADILVTENERESTK